MLKNRSDACQIYLGRARDKDDKSRMTGALSFFFRLKSSMSLRTDSAILRKGSSRKDRSVNENRIVKSRHLRGTWICLGEEVSSEKKKRHVSRKSMPESSFLCLSEKIRIGKVWRTWCQNCRIAIISRINIRLTQNIVFKRGGSSESEISMETYRRACRG